MNKKKSLVYSVTHSSNTNLKYVYSADFCFKLMFKLRTRLKIEDRDSKKCAFELRNGKGALGSIEVVEREVVGSSLALALLPSWD